MHDLTGVGACCQNRVIAERFGVAVSGTLLGFAVNLADRGIDVDHQLTPSGRHRAAHARCEGVPVDRFELADMTERERPKERPDRRRGHHPMTQHRSVAPARNM